MIGTYAGPAHLEEEDCERERQLYENFHAVVRGAGYRYLAVPSLVRRSTLERQGIVSWDDTLKVDPEWALAGSAEQGILDRFADGVTNPALYWAHNQCFRKEPYLQGLVRLREFRKTELFGFASHFSDAIRGYENALEMVSQFLSSQGIPHRRVDVAERDPGYHLRKVDIECLTRDYGWLETHSLSYFGTEQTRRLGIEGAQYTWCATGLASPRILIPLLESRTP